MGKRSMPCPSTVLACARPRHFEGTPPNTGFSNNHKHLAGEEAWEYPKRAAARRARPIRPSLVRSRAMRAHLATMNVPHLHLKRFAVTTHARTRAVLGLGPQGVMSIEALHRRDQRPCSARSWPSDFPGGPPPKRSVADWPRCSCSLAGPAASRPGSRAVLSTTGPHGFEPRGLVWRLGTRRRPGRMRLGRGRSASPSRVLDASATTVGDRLG